MEPKRVLLVLTEFPPRIGGMQTHSVYLLRHLAARGYAASVLTYQPTRDVEVHDWQAIDAQMPFPVHRILSRIGYWATLQKIEAFARTWKPDLVYCSTVFFGFLQKSLNIPVLCRSVGNDVMRPWIAWPFKPFSTFLSNRALERHLYELYERFNNPEWIERIVRTQRQVLMQTSARCMSRVIANSEFTAELLRQIGVREDRIDIVVGGVDTARFARPPGTPRDFRRSLGLPESQWMLMTACRLVPKKGIDFLISAFAQLRQHMPDAHLLIVGAGPKADRFRQLATQYGLNRFVTFAGRVEHHLMPTYYWAADVFALASRVHLNRLSGLRDAETMGRVLCEANAAEVAVMAARSGGIPSVVEHQTNGLLFEPDNIADFVATARTLRDRPDNTQAMRERGRERAKQNFDWSIIVDAHERSFARVLSER